MMIMLIVVSHMAGQLLHRVFICHSIDNMLFYDWSCSPCGALSCAIPSAWGQRCRNLRAAVHINVPSATPWFPRTE